MINFEETKMNAGVNPSADYHSEEVDAEAGRTDDSDLVTLEPKPSR